MALRALLKACRWYWAAPFRRFKNLFSRSRRLASVGLHFSAELLGRGEFYPPPSFNVGRRSQLVVPAGASLHMGPGAWIGDNCDVSVGKRISIGAHTSLQHRSQILGDVHIGAGCVCAPNLYVSSGWHHFADESHLPIRCQDARSLLAESTMRSAPVRIGDDCWLGINVVVLPGVTVGRGSVIGANSVVTKNLAPYSIAAGAPARVIGRRLEFSPPLALSAAVPEHLPYFYSGFWNWSEDGNVAAPRLSDGGWLAEEHFEIALDIAPGAQMVMTVKSLVRGRLIHAGVGADLEPGVQDAVFPARPEAWHVLAFDWLPEHTRVAPQLIVLAVSPGCMVAAPAE